MKATPLKELASYLGQKIDADALITGAAIDSRLVQGGELFFALTGNKVDGHQFLQEVSLRKAAAAVISDSYSGSTYGLSVLRVPDTLLALQTMATKLLQKSKSQVIAITGSLGKTTTKGFLKTLLSTRYKVFATPLSYNSQATLPLSIFMADGDEDFLILEMGMTEKGNLANLTAIAPPDIALLTTVAVQHATHFPDGLFGISSEKATIFCHERTRVGLLNLDMPFFSEVYQRGSCSKKTFSMVSREADFFLEQLTEDSVCIHEKDNCSHVIDLKLPMKAHYQNFLAAVAVARTLNVSFQQIGEAAKSLKLPPMRFEQVEKSGIHFINDAYNANPDSMIAALKSLPKPLPGGKTIAVLSEMDALGTYSEEGHRAVAETALQCADLLFCLGPRSRAMKQHWTQASKPAHYFEDILVLVTQLKQMAEPGDVILLKGARAYALDKVLQFF